MSEEDEETTTEVVTEVLPAEQADDPKPIDTKAKQRYDVLKIMSLRNKGLSYQEIANQIGCAKSTAYETIKRLRESFPELDTVDEYEATKHDLLSAAESRLLKSVMDRDLSEEKISSIVSAFDKLFKARRVQTGQSTENIAVKTFHTTEKDED